MRLYRKFLIAAGIAVAVVALTYGVALIAFMASGPFRMIPQDCILLSRSLDIRVNDARSSRPIGNAHLLIHNVGGHGFDGGTVKLEATTDSDGIYHVNQLPIFACDALITEVSAEGYETTATTYNADKGFDQSAELSSTIKLAPKQP